MRASRRKSAAVKLALNAINLANRSPTLRSASVGPLSLAQGRAFRFSGRQPGPAVDRILERPAGAQRDATHRVVGNTDWQARLIGDHLAEFAQERSSARHRDALVDHVGRDFRLGMLQRRAHDLDDVVDRLRKRFGHL